MMGRSPSRGRRGPQQASSAREGELSFDFVVAKRPKYVPNSGPPLAPLSLLPANDKDGIILESVTILGKLRYIVGYTDSPHMRILVEARNILDWVSPYMYEKYGAEQASIQQKIWQEEELRRSKAKEERRIRREAKMAGKDGQSRGQESGRKRKRVTMIGKPRKLSKPKGDQKNPTMSRKAFGPGQRQQAEHKGGYFKSPRKFTSNPQQPSLSTPTRRLADKLAASLDSEDELGSASTLNGQLSPGGRRFYISLPSSASKTPLLGSFRSSNISKSMASIPKTSGLKSPSLFGTKSRMSTISDLQLRSPSRTKEFGREAHTSSLGARVIYEKLERGSQVAQKLPSNKKEELLFNRVLQSPSDHPQAIATKLDDQFPDEDSDQKYEMKAILDDAVRDFNGEKQTLYLIKWVGPWDDTWEPADNVDVEAIMQYNRTKAKIAAAPGLSKRQLVERGDCLLNGGSSQKVNGRLDGSAYYRGTVVDEDSDDFMELLQ